MCVNIKSKLSNEINLILSKTALINTCIEFYKQLIDIKSNQNYKYSMGENFFNSVSIAYDYVIVCELAKLYGCNEEKGSLYSILRVCQNNISLFTNIQEYISEVSTELKSVDTQTIKTYRDKYLAHCDKKYFGKSNELQIQYKFDLDYFSKLNNYAIKVLSKINSEIQDAVFIYNPNLLSGFDLYKIIEQIPDK